MNQPTPRSAAPALQRRQQLVADAMASLDGIDDLTTADQFARLQAVQQVLAGVLQNDADLNQLAIPGVSASLAQSGGVAQSAGSQG